MAAAILAERSGLSADDPEPQISATALLGLWRIQFLSLSRDLDGARTAAQVHQAVTGDVLRAARLYGAGLDSLGPADGGNGERAWSHLNPRWSGRTAASPGRGRTRDPEGRAVALVRPRVEGSRGDRGGVRDRSILRI